MSATEVIELYDALPAQEQRLVAEHISRDAAVQTAGAKPLAEFKDVVNRVFDKHSQLMERLAQ
ncbi:hypothetical protein [Prosthecobacter sp.]|uniref:hypothetical protein n=1 Tax=Prosthecobacter sp. TaxID=1965333 RepID=UPI003784879D